MARWDLVFDLESGSAQPLSVQIGRAVAAAIRDGRLGPGTRLPGSRTLAKSLGVSRNTIDAAYRELTAEGWITATRSRGTFVNESLPAARPRRFTTARVAPRRDRVGFDVHAPRIASVRTYDRESLSVRGINWDFGVPDVRLAPTRELARAYRRALARPMRGLDYDLLHKIRSLDDELASMLSTSRGLAVSPENLVVTRGSQMALYLTARALVRPGDVVAVEDPGYPGAWDVFRLAGAQLVRAPVDAAGISVEHLERLTRRTRIRAVFVTSHHQLPTTVTLSAERRLRLLELARERRFAIVEDDYDHEFHYDGRPVLPLASADTAGVVIYLGSLSKILAPGLRIGYLVAPTEIVERVRDLRAVVDLQGDRLTELAIAALFEDGDVQRHWRRSRRVYRARRDHLASLLRAELGAVLQFDDPPGGLAIWAEVAKGVDVEAWALRARGRGLAFRTGAMFFMDGKPRPFVRLGFARLDERELGEAVSQMVAAL